MSFILDALKKIEQDKRRSDGSHGESIAVARERYRGRQPMVAMVAIAIGSALLTAAAVSFLSKPSEVAPTAPVADASAPPGNAREIDPDPAPVSAVPPSGAREASVRVNPVPPPKPATKNATSEVAEAADVEPSPNENVENGVQAIRIVGRERALLDGLSISSAGPSSDDAGLATVDDEGDAPGEDEALPADFPALVLQGTSMIGEEAVAVISDQRVFEGDRIEGALVLRIGEREVELELEGRRFTLRL